MHFSRLTVMMVAKQIARSLIFLIHLELYERIYCSFYMIMVKAFKQRCFMQKVPKPMASCSQPSALIGSMSLSAATNKPYRIWWQEDKECIL